MTSAAITEAAAQARAAGVVGYAASISKIAAADQLQAVVDSLAKAVLDGETFDSWKAGVEAGNVDLGMSAAARTTVVRTNIQTVYQAARYAAQVSDLANRPYFMYDAINDSRTRETHAAMSGYVAPADDPIWAIWYPPCGYNCRCTVHSLTQAEAIDRGYEPGNSAPNVQPDPGFGFSPAKKGLDSVVTETLAAKHDTLSNEILLSLEAALTK